MTQTVINLIWEFDGINPEATILWKDHVKNIMKKTGFDLLEIGMRKLKGTALCDVKAISKEGNLSHFLFSQLPIEHYLNVPYA